MIEYRIDFRRESVRNEAFASLSAGFPHVYICENMPCFLSIMVEAALILGRIDLKIHLRTDRPSGFGWVCIWTLGWPCGPRVRSPCPVNFPTCVRVDSQQREQCEREGRQWPGPV